jgi:hypothetical protein
MEKRASLARRQPGAFFSRYRSLTFFLSFSGRIYCFSRRKRAKSPNVADYAVQTTQFIRPYTPGTPGRRLWALNKQRAIDNGRNFVISPAPKYFTASCAPARALSPPVAAESAPGEVWLPLEDAVMRRWKILGGLMWLEMLLLTSLAGCAVSVQPWTKPAPAASPAPDAAAANPHAPAGFKAPMPSPYPPTPYPPPAAFPANAYPPNGYPPSGYPQTSSAGNESISQLIKQLNETDDQRKALLEQVQVLKKQTRERDDHLQHASYEMEESSKQLKRTREEVRQFAGEMDDLRDRMRKLEEMRTALKPLIDEIMYHLEREKESSKSARIPAPTK